jgi:hypothetical protein
MKKTLTMYAVIFFITVGAMSFKNKENTRSYGGSASASVAMYEAVFTADGTKKGKKVDDFKLDATVRCSFSTEADAKTSLKQDLNDQLLAKQGTGKIGEFTSSINYDISFCEN